MKKLALFVFLVFPVGLIAQVGIGSQSFTPDRSSVLELRSDSKGLLIPRLSKIQKDDIVDPKTGLLVFQIDELPGFYFFDGSKWELIISQSGLAVTDFQDLSFDATNAMLSLENGGQVDLSILKNGRSIESTTDNGDGTLTFNFNDGTSFTTSNLRGQQGPKGDKGIDGTNGVDGKDGLSLLNGSGAPANTLGNNGDHYVDPTNGLFYGPKTAGTWPAPVSLIGPKGADGINGTNGVDGKDGADGTNGVDGKNGLSLLNGSGAPANTLGNDGDHYVDSANGHLYGPKTAGTWPAPVSLIGPKGADGINGTNGVDGKDGTDGTNGLDGKDGLSILNGSGAPANTLGNDGDHYVDAANGLLYGPKTAGTWPAPVSLIGPKGADGIDGTNGVDGKDGADGTNGLSLLNGSGAPANTLGNDGDHYVDATNGLFYGPKTAGIWPVPVSLIGPKGADGIDGTNGVDGKDGTDGINGVDGKDGTDGQNGKTILSGNNNPSTTTGTDGDFYLNLSSLDLFGPKAGGLWPTPISLVGTGITSSIDNPDGSITFNYSDGTSFTSQPDADFDSSNELITSISLSNKTLQIVENGNSRSIDLSPALGSTAIKDNDGNTSIETDLSDANDNLIRFTVNGIERLRLNNRTLEFTNTNSSVMIGESTGLASTGAGNTFIGSESGNKSTSGKFNTALGYRSLRQNTTGEGNVAIGYNAGFNETGSNKLYIDNSNTNKPLVYGDFSSDYININGKLGVDITNPATISNELEVNGSAMVISLTETSDQRLKKNIEAIADPLSLIDQLNGVSYEWRQDEFPDRKFKPGRKLGFLAQEVKTVLPELVNEGFGGYYSVSYTGFVPVLVEAVKQQQDQIEALEKRLTELESKLTNLIDQLEK